jgi:MFS family permease
VADISGRRKRRWADIVAIIASVTALGNAMWGPLIFSTISTRVTTDQGAGYNWFAFGVGGILGVLGLIVAQKRPVPGRIALAIGGLLLVAVPFVYESRALLPIATSVVLGVAMLVSSLFLGPMPAPRHMTEGRQARP